MRGPSPSRRWPQLPKMIVPTKKKARSHGAITNSTSRFVSVANQASPRLVRPREGRVIAGVAAGLADRFGMDRQTMRMIFLVSLLLPGPQILVYVVLWMIMPEGD